MHLCAIRAPYCGAVSLNLRSEFECQIRRQLANSANISFLIKPAACFSQSFSRQGTGNSKFRMHLRASPMSLTMLVNVAALNFSGAKFKQWVNPRISLCNRLYSFVALGQCR